MITFLVSDLNRNPLRKLVRRSARSLPPMRLLTYQTAFRRLWVPTGTLVFTDFDLLTDYELDAVGTIAKAAEGAGDQVRILNHPMRAMERAAMLRHLHDEGLNPVAVTRVDDEMPLKYPVFIRLQGGCERPDTGLLPDEDSFIAARNALLAAGRPLRGRIAVSFEAERSHDGSYRKYGAFRIGDRIVPQHILRGPDWYVKRMHRTTDPDFLAEEVELIRDNPHADTLMRLFDAAGLDFGRADYGIRDGKVVLYEINTNPSFPNLNRGRKHPEGRHAYLAGAVPKAFEAIDHPGTGRVPFTLNIAIGHNISRRRWNPIDRQLWRLRLAAKSERGFVVPGVDPPE